VIYGSRLSIMVGVSSALLSAVLGTVLGMLAGYKGGRFEQVIMRFADAHLAFPEILLAILIIAAIGGSALNLILVLGISGWMVYARVMYNLVCAVDGVPGFSGPPSVGGMPPPRRSDATCRRRWVTVYCGWRPNLPDEGDNHLIGLALARGA
jgi:hypothetical protein